MVFRVDQLLVLGMGNLQPLIGNPYHGLINPYYWVDDHSVLYGNVMGVDRPDRTGGFSRFPPFRFQSGYFPESTQRNSSWRRSNNLKVSRMPAQNLYSNGCCFFLESNPSVLQAMPAWMDNIYIYTCICTSLVSSRETQFYQS